MPLGQGRPVWVDDPHFNAALPHPPQRAARAGLRRAAQAPGRAPVRASAGPRPSRCGRSSSSRASERRPLRDHLQDPPRAGRRRQRRRHHLGPLRRRRPTRRPSAAAARGGCRAPSPTRRRAAGRGAARAHDGPGRGRARPARADPRAAPGRSGASPSGSPASARWRAPGSAPRRPRPFNVPIGPHRRYTWVDADLARFKAIKYALGGTLNDVVLTAVALALGRWLRARGHDTDGLVLQAMVPVSVRAETQQRRAGQPRGGDVGAAAGRRHGPARRASRRCTRRWGTSRSSGQAVGAETLTALADFAPPTIMSQAARLQARQRFFNLVVTNVPGPADPALPARPPPGAPLPRRAARPEPGARHRDHELRRPARLRPARRLRRDGATSRRWPTTSRRRSTTLARRSRPALGRIGRAGAARSVPSADAPRGRAVILGVRRDAPRPRPAQRHRRRHRRQRGRDRASARARARRPARSSSLFPELAITGYPPEDLLLKEHFLRRRARGGRADRRGRARDRGARRLPRARRRRLQRRRGAGRRPRPGHLPQGQPAQLRRLRRAALLPARAGRAIDRGRRRQGRPDDLRGHLGARAAR